MKHNGNAFQAYMEEVNNYLQAISVLDYYQDPVPTITDQWFDQTITRFQSLTAKQRDALQSKLTQSQRATFGIYGHRAATRAVRKESSRILLDGLTGTVIANYVIPDNRRVEVSLAIFHHCARELAIEPDILFRQAAGYALPDLADFLIQFGNRGDVTLKKYGWKAMHSPDGIIFRFSW